MSQQHVSIFCISNRVSFQESLVGLGFIMKLSYEIWLRIESQCTAYSTAKEWIVYWVKVHIQSSRDRVQLG